MANKKIHFLIFAILLIATSQFILVSAQEDPSDVSGVIGNEFNISPEKIPTTPEDIEEIQSNYLKKEWESVILKSKYIGPVHNFFKSNSFIFQIIFAYDYELSWVFLGIVFLWFFVFLLSAKFFASSGIAKESIAYLLGIAAAIITAQIRLLKLIVSLVAEMSSKLSTWWGKLIFIIILFGIVAILSVLLRMLSNSLKEKRRKKKEEKSSQKLKEMEELSGGIKDIAS